MPSKPTLLLTRPAPQARRFAADCEAMAGPGYDVVFAPVIEIRSIGNAPDAASYDAIILSSENGALVAPDLRGKRVYCVGNRTSAAARKAGAQVEITAQTADALVAEILKVRPLGRMLHLRGTHTRGEIAKRLNSGGIETDDSVIYDQAPLALSKCAIALIEGDRRVILPLFSPRSARLVGRAVDRPGANIHVIAISGAVAEAWREETGGNAVICASPTGDCMMDAIVAELRC